MCRHAHKSSFGKRTEASFDSIAAYAEVLWETLICKHITVGFSGGLETSSRLLKSKSVTGPHCTNAHNMTQLLVLHVDEHPSVRVAFACVRLRVCLCLCGYMCASVSGLTR